MLEFTKYFEKLSEKSNLKQLRTEKGHRIRTMKAKATGNEATVCGITCKATAENRWEPSTKREAQIQEAYDGWEHWRGA